MYCEEIHFKRDVASIFCMHYIFLGAIFSLGWCCSDDECRNIMFKEPVPDKVMKNHVIRREEVPNEGSCRVMCYMDPDCVSINLGPLKGGKHKCELNSATDESLENEPAYTYIAIENPCSSSPCLNDGSCQAGFTSKCYHCLCLDGSSGEYCQTAYRNCADIFKSGKKRDGVYTVKPDNLSSFDVFCDQTTSGGGWTVFQKRLDGSVDFYLNWSDYKHGFGHLSGEFWLGLDKIHRLTSDHNSMLRVDLEDFDGNTAYAEYSMFGVMGEGDKYQLILGLYKQGTAGDSLSYHQGRPFTTQDQENDIDPNGNCAVTFHGAWWYKWCHKVNLNGPYVRGYHSEYGYGVNWQGFKGYHYSLKSTQMKIRPREL